jgi:hypothetical protein
MVPPAFPEVWKPMAEGYLKQFKYNTAYPAHLHVSDNHHFEPPSEQVSEKVNIYGCLIHIVKHALGILRCVDPTIICITFFWQGDS